MAIYKIIHTEELVGEFYVEADSQAEALKEYEYQVDNGSIDFSDMEMVDSSDVAVLDEEAGAMSPQVERLKSYVDRVKNTIAEGKSVSPVYEICLFRYPCKELIFEKDGKKIPSGTPYANLNSMGFYYNLDDAVEVMHDNVCDIQETVFHAGFILCRFPGLYYGAGPDSRIFFLWDEERKGFFEVDEPELFKHIAY